MEPEIKEVLDKSGVLEDIVPLVYLQGHIQAGSTAVDICLKRSQAYHRRLDVKSGLTVQNLRTICAFI